MVATLVRKERRPMWVALAVVLAAAATGSAWLANGARHTALVDATVDARAIAQMTLAPLVGPKELAEPITGERARQLREDVARDITSLGRFDDVRIFSSQGRALFAQDPQQSGVRAANAMSFVGAAANGPARSRIVDGTFEAFIPVWTTPGGTVVAELSGPADAISSAGHPWSLAAIAAGALAALSLAMAAVASRSGSRQDEPRTSLYQPAIPRRARAERDAPATVDVFATDERAQLRERLAQAEARAEAAEESFRTVQAQLKLTLAQIGELEGRLVMQDEAVATADREIAALRTQVTETAERLHKAELDNNAMRERMALRQQELEVARRRAEATRLSDAEIEELTLRLDTAEQAAAALERELARVETELDHTKSSLHMTKLSEALRDLDAEDADADDEHGMAVSIDDEDDDLYEHPVIIGNGSRLSSGKVR